MRSNKHQCNTFSNTKQPLFLLTDSLSTRVFFSCGIIQRIWREQRGKLVVLALFDINSVFDYRRWLKPDENIVVESMESLGLAKSNSLTEKLKKMIDRWLDRHFGFFPLAVRFSIYHKYHLGRFQRGHRNPFLNSSLALPFPRSLRLLEFFRCWYFSTIRHVDLALKTYLSENISFIIPTNLQVFQTQQFLHASRQLGLNVIGHIGSWDHPVGKGVISPHCCRYIVQNEYMAEKLISQHSIAREKVVVTGWPQMDSYAQLRSTKEFIDLIREYELVSDKPCILIAGNSEANSPYEPEFVRKLISWWEDNANEDFSIIFRPHPRDIIQDNWKVRFGFLLGKENVYVQAANYADIEVLSLMLQHVSCVITNAGTILLDSIVNNRPVVCVLYDEGAPRESRCAINNIAGDHYKTMMEADAFVTAYNFDEVVGGLLDNLLYPARYEKARHALSRKIAGIIDGKSGKRVANIISSTLKSKGK